MVKPASKFVAWFRTRRLRKTGGGRLCYILCSDDLPTIKTSIISFIRDAAQRSANKKRRGKPATPTKANSLFEDISSVQNKIPEQVTPSKDSSSINVTPESETGAEKENDNENVRVTRKRKSHSDSNKPAKTPRKDYEDTLFGFDDSENQENISPINIDVHKRELRPKARKVLKQINDQAGPMRAAIPLAAKSAVNSLTVQKLYNEMRPVVATKAPIFPEKIPIENIEATEVEEMLRDDLNEDAESVHLFEDIEVVHHLKPTRKSYSKAKKVTFPQQSTSDSDIVEEQNHDGSSDEDHLRDLTFELPAKKKVSRRKPTKKQKLSKKEEKEAEAWVAEFNSMCEDIDDFPLVVE